MTKIKIGDNEYEGPFDTESSAYDCPHRTVSDEAGNQVSSWDITIALNELSQLRAENAALVKEIAEAVEIIESEEAALKAEFGPNEIVSDADKWLQRNKAARHGGAK